MRQRRFSSNMSNAHWVKTQIRGSWSATILCSMSKTNRQVVCGRGRHL